MKLLVCEIGVCWSEGRRNEGGVCVDLLVCCSSLRAAGRRSDDGGAIVQWCGVVVSLGTFPLLSQYHLHVQLPTNNFEVQQSSFAVVLALFRYGSLFTQ